MKEPNVTALIVARPGEMRDGVRALLAATPRVAHISQADNGPAALVLVRELCPQVAVLDSNIPDGDIPALLTSIKAACPQTRCLVLADGADQQREAQSAGADVTVLKGFPAARLAQTLAGLLQEN